MATFFGQAIASAVVVGVMVSQGFDIPLSDIASSAGASEAFIDGWLAAHALLVALAWGGAVLAFFTTAPERQPKKTTV